MKIALSASHGGNPDAIKMLQDCELIYTTQIQNRDELFKTFGEGTVLFIPDATSSTVDWIKSRHEDAEFVTFSDLMRVRNADADSGFVPGMRLFKIKFTPKQPVGCHLILIAESKGKALLQAKTLVTDQVLTLKNVTEVVASQPGVVSFDDGDY